MSSDEEDDDEGLLQRSRVSKQAKMLGVEVDAAPRGLEGWNGWGSSNSTPGARPVSPTGPNDSSVAPWDLPHARLAPAPPAPSGRRGSVVPAALLAAFASPNRAAKVPPPPLPPLPSFPNAMPVASSNEASSRDKKWGVSSIFRKPGKGIHLEDQDAHGEFGGAARRKSMAPPAGVTALDRDFRDMDGIILPSSSASPAARPGMRHSSSSSGSTNDASTPSTDRRTSDGSLANPRSGSIVIIPTDYMRKGSSASATRACAGTVPPPPTFNVEPASPPSAHGRPHFERTNSGGSVHSLSGISFPIGRRPTVAGLPLGLLRGVASPTPPPPGVGAWSAPDSWAIKDDEETGTMEHESSEEEELADVVGPLGDEGMSPASTDVASFRDDPDGSFGVSGRAPRKRSRRPGASGGMLNSAGSKDFTIRVYRPDEPVVTIPVSLTASTTVVLAALGRKFDVNVKSSYSLYKREKGLERRMGPGEKPVKLQKRRFEQAGYTELDRLEEVGRDDNSYMVKLIFKPTSPLVSINGDVGDSFVSVDISGKNVETIPIYLYRHAHEIVSLNLSKNRPFDLPSDFVQGCASLRALTLCHMGLKRIPQAVRECFSLTYLDLSDNHVVELEHIALDRVAGLASLQCRNNRLWQLPAYFSTFEHLKFINLSNNRLDTIPAVVCEIHALVELDVSFNTITTVPAEIGQLFNLERIILLANTITSLPPSLRALVRLKELDCRRNNLSDLSAISGIPRLEILRCEFNQASALDANWAHLRVLSASNNSITRFALSGTSRTLTSLDLSHAKLSSLATNMFAHLGAVEHLHFDSNQFRVLPEGVGSLANLVTLSIKNNILDELPATVSNLRRLERLEVSGNNLRELPPQLWLCSELTVLNASSNLLRDFPDPPRPSKPAPPPPQGLGKLDARHSSTSSSRSPSVLEDRIPPLALSLRKLYLADNRLADEVFGPLSLMTELRVLNLSFNEIYEIPSSSLFGSQMLEELYLSGNKLTSLPPDDLECLASLKILYLNGNKLQTLPAELGKIKSLSALDAGSNVLKYNVTNWPYDWNWNYNPELRYLNLSGNKRLEIKPSNQNSASVPQSAKRNVADFSALAKLRVLGLVDTTLMIPAVPDESEHRRVRTSLSQINEMGYGIADTLGAQVDTLSLVDFAIPQFRSTDHEAVFGLFDAVSTSSGVGSGGGGAKLVKYLQNHFSTVFTLELSRLKSGEFTSDALRRAFININRDYGNQLLPTLDSRRNASDVNLSPPDGRAYSAPAGAAGVVVYIRRKRMYVANAGDALAVISNRGGSARLVAKKHEPLDTQEIARIRAAEGWISHHGSVNGEVDVSRSFGFYDHFPAVSAAPNVEEIELVDTDEFVIVASHGLWDHVSYQAAVDVARGERTDPMFAAAKLRDMAIAYGATQGVMVMVLAVGDLFKSKKDLRAVRSHSNEDAFYGQRAVQRRGLERDDQVGDRGLNSLDREVDPPVGHIALVFTDIRNSTMLWDTHPAAMQTAIRMHNLLFRRQLRAIGGYEVKTEGDAFRVCFPTVMSALLWCLTCQLELLREDWPQELLDSKECREITNAHGEVLYRGVSVRMGIHWGEPVCELDPVTRRMDYFGPMVNRSARISGVADGGQISASQEVFDIIERVVMDHKPPPSSLDSDSSGDEDEEEEALSPTEKQDVLALRRLGFGVSELGVRQLMGSETAEMLSVFWPSTLKDRIKEAGDKGQTGVERTKQVIDDNLVRELGNICRRLQLVAANFAHPPPPSEDRPPTALLASRGQHLRPTGMSFTGVRPESTDEDLGVLIEHYLGRIEHSLSTLMLVHFGPLAEALAVPGGAVMGDPQHILSALSRFGALVASGA